MSVPPPPNPYGAQPPSGGQPQGPPPWGSQPPPQWSGPSGPPAGRGGRGKWILGGVAVVLAIALAVVVTVLVIRPDSGGGGSTTPTPGASEFASAGDVGPVNIITEDPTCEAWGSVGREYSKKLTYLKWDERDESTTATAWTPEQRKVYTAAAEAMSAVAGQTVELAKQTPHRVMRELYQQFNAYTNAFVAEINSYKPSDNNIIVVSDALGNSLNDICTAISSRSSAAIAPLVPDPRPPSAVAATSDSSASNRFLASANPVCAPWAAEVSKFSDSTTAWLAIDAQLSAAQWTPEERAVNEAVVPIMSANSDELERLGRQSDNSTLEDLAVLAAQYQRAYVLALPNYAAPDGFLAQVTTFIVKVVDWACKAAA